MTLENFLVKKKDWKLIWKIPCILHIKNSEPSYKVEATSTTKKSTNFKKYRRSLGEL